MSLNKRNASQHCLKDDIGNLNDVDKAQLGRVGAIHLPSIVGNVVLHVDKTILQLY